MVYDVSHLYSFEFKIYFNESITSFESLSEGGFLSEDYNYETSCFGPSKQAAGVYLYSCIRELIPPYSGVSGSGKLAVLRLYSQSPGETKIELKETILHPYYNVNTRINHTVSDGYAYVNRAPYIDVWYSDSTVYTDESIVCESYSTDADNNIKTIIYSFYVNDVLQEQGIPESLVRS